MRRFGPICPNDNIVPRISLGQEPPPAAEPVVPPLPLHPGLVLAEVEVVYPLLGWGVQRGPGERLAAEAEVIGAALAAVGASQKERQCLAPHLSLSHQLGKPLHLVQLRDAWLAYQFVHAYVSETLNRALHHLGRGRYSSDVCRLVCSSLKRLHCNQMQPSARNWRSHCAGLSNLIVRMPNCAAAVRFTSVSSMNTVFAPSSPYVSSR